MSKSLSQHEIAALLGLTPRQIQNLVKAGMPQEVAGRHPCYPVPGAVRWYVEFKEQAAEERSAPVDFDRAHARRELALASQEELKLAEKLGQLMTVEQFRAARFDADARVAAKLKALENRLAPAVVGTVDVQDGLVRVKPLIAEVMDELFRGADLPADAEEDETAA